MNQCNDAAMAADAEAALEALNRPRNSAATDVAATHPEAGRDDDDGDDDDDDVARIRYAATSTGTNEDNNALVAANATIVADATMASGAGATVEVLNHVSFQLWRLLEQGDEIQGDEIKETGMTRTEIEDLIQSIDKFTASVRLSSSSIELGARATNDLSERPFATSW